jgi:multidrug resistance efflux pump
MSNLKSATLLASVAIAVGSNFRAMAGPPATVPAVTPVPVTPVQVTPVQATTVQATTIPATTVAATTVPATLIPATGSGGADIIASAAGVIQTVLVRNGSRVKHGDALLQLDGCHQARQTLDDAATAVNSARETLHQFEEAAKKRMVDSSEVVDARDQLKQAEKAVEIAQQAVDALTVTAPADGTVQGLTLRPGDSVTASEMLGRIESQRLPG